MRSKKISAEASELKRIYAEFGVNTEEFYHQVIKFFWYLQQRYIGRRVPELDNDFWAKLVLSMEYYDPSKLNIVSWCHTIGRGVCSSYTYHWKKRLQESPEPLSTIQEDFDRGNNWTTPEDLAEIFRDSIIQFDAGKLSSNLHQLPETNPLMRTIQWELSRSR